MRIVPYSDNDDIDNIESLSVIIKAIPFEGSFVPVFFLNVNSEDHEISLDELNALMDGLEIATKHIDSMIDWMIQPIYGIKETNEIPPEILDKLLDGDDEEDEDIE
jgi:hypothetical protein